MSGTILVTGGTGFVGSRLVPVLVDAGHEVRVMTRRPAEYDGPGIAVHGDVDRPETLTAALSGVRAVYYLVHSLGSADFEERDAAGASAVGRAAAVAGVKQIIYLGGLGDAGDDLSPHLRSRRDVEVRLADGGVPVTVLRAGIVVGHGGISWEITRQLVEHLPAMVTPRWVRTRTQPIAVRDVVQYLADVLDNPHAVGRTFEVGGRDVLTYAAMLQRLAALQGRSLPILPLPLLTPALSSRWLALVTDVDTRTGRTLVDSMVNEVIVRDPAIREVVDLVPMGYDDAVREALEERGRRR